MGNRRGGGGFAMGSDPGRAAATPSAAQHARASSSADQRARTRRLGLDGSSRPRQDIALPDPIYQRTYLKPI